MRVSTLCLPWHLLYLGAGETMPYNGLFNSLKFILFSFCQLAFHSSKIPSFDKYLPPSKNEEMNITAKLLVLVILIAVSRQDHLILSLDDAALGPAPCARTCAGTTRGSGWTSYSPGYVFTTVDITECGFVSTPVITTTLKGSNDFVSLITGTSSVYQVKRSSFGIRLEGYVTTAHYSWTSKITQSYAEACHWRINWFASGFTC